MQSTAYGKMQSGCAVFEWVICRCWCTG